MGKFQYQEREEVVKYIRERWLACNSRFLRMESVAQMYKLALVRRNDHFEFMQEGNEIIIKLVHR